MACLECSNFSKTFTLQAASCFDFLPPLETVILISEEEYRKSAVTFIIFSFKCLLEMLNIYVQHQKPVIYTTCGGIPGLFC